MRSSIAEIKSFLTKDGSEIRELIHPAIHKNKALSLAEATISPGKKTLLHKHHASEEIYHIIRGAGIMTLGSKQFPIRPGDTICILPRTAHSLQNSGNEPLKILCSCAPPYSHEDTTILTDP